MRTSMRTILSALAMIVCLSFASALKAEDLKGVWKYKTNDNSSTVSYKIFTKDGRYMNIRSKDNGRTFYMKQRGVFEKLMPGVYVEHLGADVDRPSSGTPIMMSYKFQKGLLIVTFKLGNSVYNEVWEKADKAPVW